MLTRPIRFAVAALCGALLVAGCGGTEDQEPASEGTSKGSEPTSETSDSPPPPPPPPAENACYRLSENAAAAAHSESEPVGCAQPHTTRTYFVGKLLPRVVGKSDTINSEAISRTVERRCSEAFADHIGGDADTRTLSRLRYVWFVPTEQEYARGADWFRCDVYADRGGGRPARLPADTKRLLDDSEALDDWGTCDQTDGNLNPEAQWRPCHVRHNWRAVSVVSLGDADASWPGAGALEDRATECEASVRDYLDNQTGALALQWSYPTREQWSAGRRFGLCWTKAN